MNDNYLLEEWKQVNDYINRIEVDHTAKFAIFLSGIIVSLATLAGSVKNCSDEALSYVFAIIPIATIGMLAYTIFQFKNNEIARGYLYYLEKKIYKETGYKCIRHKELYKFFRYGPMVTPLIIFLALFSLEFFCIALSRIFLKSWAPCLRITYWIVIIVTVMLLFLYFWMYKEKLQKNMRDYFEERMDHDYRKINAKDFKNWSKGKSGNKRKCLKCIIFIIGVGINALAIILAIILLKST